MYTPKNFTVTLRLSGYSKAAAVRLLQQGAQVKLELAEEYKDQLQPGFLQLVKCAAELQKAAHVLQEAE